MLTKSDLLASLAHETKIILHLAKQLKPKQLGYKPTPKQRSTLELLRYLSIVGEATLLYVLSGKWDHWQGLELRSAKVSAKNFPSAMRGQLKTMTKLLAGHTDAQIAASSALDFHGAKISLGVALLELVLKMFTAYRMQLFLYAKASGLHGLGTSDCWTGKAAKKS